MQVIVGVETAPLALKPKTAVPFAARLPFQLTLLTATALPLGV